jgi:hypothetical protein
MSTEATRCPKCNGVMVQGFIIDWQGAQFSRVSNWVEGAPGKATWFGTIVPAPAENCIPVYLPLFGVWFPGVVCAPGICCQVTKLADLKRTG